MPASEPATHHCPTCGAILDFRDAGGLCVACLLGETLEPGKPTRGLGSIGGHELIEIIARGGMGIVYRARQSEPEREVALKALPGAELLSEEARARFKVEAQAMAKLDHPAIVPVYELGEEDGTPFFTMKLATGGTLSQRMGDYAGKWREIAELIVRIAEAVQFAHSRGVLHRDLKPGNILFDEEGNALVSDFGLAKMLGTESDLTRTLSTMGTPNYMAPELAQKNGGVSTASDVWSLGVILYELLAGRVPFSGNSLPAVLRAVAEDEPAALQGRTSNAEPRTLNIERLPRDLAIITFKALQKDPVRRYGTAQALADDLRRWLAGEPIHARPVFVPERVWLWAKRKPALAAMLALLVLTLAASTGLLLRANRKLQGAVMTAQQQEERAEDALRESLTRQAGLMRQSIQTGQRFKTLALIRQAVTAGGPSIELRHEAAAALAEPDVELVGEIARFKPTGRDGRSVTVTPDLRLMLCLDADDGEVALRDLSAGKIVWRPSVRRSPAPDQFYLSDSGQYAGLVFPDHSVEVWDTQANRLVHSTLLQPKEKEAAYRHKARPFHLHAKLPLSAGVDRAGTLWLHDLTTGQRTDGRQGAMPEASAVFLTENGDTIAAATGTGIELWQIADKRMLWRFPMVDPGELFDGAGKYLMTFDRNTRDAVVVFGGNHSARYVSPNISVVAGCLIPHTKLAVALDLQGVVSTWDVRDGRAVWQLRGGSGALMAAEDGRALLIEGENGHLMKWQHAPDRVFGEFYHPEDNRGGASTEQIEVSPDDRLISTHGNTAAMLWNARERSFISMKGLKGGEKPGASSAFSADSTAWYISRDGAGIHRHSIDWAEDGSLRLGVPTLVPGSEGKWLSHISPDGQTWVLRNLGAPYQLWRPDGTAPEHQIKDKLQPGQRLSPALRFAYTRQYSAGRRIILDARTGQPCGEYSAAEPGLASFSPGEQWLLLREPSAYRFIETTTWQQRAAVPSSVPRGQTPDAAISDDGTLAAVEQDEDVIHLISLPTGRLLVKLIAPQPINTAGLRFSHDGTRLYVLGLRHRLFEWNLLALHEELAKLGLEW
ncbi:MAG: protein kinase [Verrucomicrobiaceae bacterium]|nr:protein kinase [Verrucomicrobiaceae bacterium]